MIIVKKFKDVEGSKYIALYYKDLESSCSLVIAHNNGYIDLQEFYRFVRKSTIPGIHPNHLCLVKEQ